MKKGEMIMIKYYEIPSNNIISSYGGIGSLVETPKGSIKILPLEKWPYFIYEIAGKDREHIENLSINDLRLIKRLKNTFKDLEFLIKVPVNSTIQGGYRVKMENNIISAEYFPKWMFCPHCLRFMKYEDWNKRFQMNHIGKEFDLYCPDCLRPSSGKKPLRILLEQVRFIKISESGDMEDFPWEKWFDNKNNGINNCSKHEFFYKTSPYSDNLESIRIYCKKCNASASLSGIFESESNKEHMRTVLKSSNSVYFPVIVRSLFIPLFKDNTSNKPESEKDYRCSEFEYMLDKMNNGKDTDEDTPYLKAFPIDYKGISLISIRFLYMTSVLCSYSRVSPVAVGTIYEKGRSIHVTKNCLNTRYLPCIESQGEGFLLIFDDILIKKWYKHANNNQLFVEKIDNYFKNPSIYAPFELLSSSRYALCKYILLHTLSHLLINQLEYVCGYPSASINERIYVSDDYHAGIMIYTVAGSEGSYGGIVTFIEKGGLGDLINQAIENARFCTNDPVCYNQTSVCFSCCLVPETSCECFNSLLDRSFIVDELYGFNKFISKQ